MRIFRFAALAALAAAWAAGARGSYGFAHGAASGFSALASAVRFDFASSAWAGSPSPKATDEEQARAPQKFLSPARADGINDAAVFGPNAREVSIFNGKGARVFRASRAASGPAIVWDCRDGSGRIVPSGVYVARIVTIQSRRVHQTFAVAR